MRMETLLPKVIHVEMMEQMHSLQTDLLDRMDTLEENNQRLAENKMEDLPTCDRDLERPSA